MIVPGFAYAAIAILSLVLVLAAILLLTTPRRPNRLCKDPATLGALMDIVEYDPITTDLFSNLDTAGKDTLSSAISDKSFEFRSNSAPAHLTRFGTSRVKNGIPRGDLMDSNEECFKKERKGVRPLEMKSAIGAVFLILQLAAIITFAVLFFKSRHENGEVSPSTKN
jgi:hypothetical protein